MTSHQPPAILPNTMPRKIVTHDGQTFEFRAYDLPALGPNEVRVQVEFAAPKHGTEKKILTDSSFVRKKWDPELRMFLPRSPSETETPAPPAERQLGNMVVGRVIEIGGDVVRYQVGDRVFGYGPICEVHQAAENKWWPLGDLTPQDAVAVDPSHVAFVAVRDGNIRIGDDVAIYGLGAIGLMAVQIARAAGANKVFAVDPLPIRREYALTHGADAAFDPVNVDAALQIKLATDKHGVDVSVETSGNGRALHDSIRCIRQCGTIVHVPWGPANATDLHLDEEFHHNRPTIVGSQAWEGHGNPDRSYPLWTHQRAFEAAIQLFRDGKITGQGLITPIVPFEEADQRLAETFNAPASTIKIGVQF